MTVDMQDIDFEVVDDPDAVFIKLTTEPVLCLLLNPKLSLSQIRAYEDSDHIVLDVEHEGKPYKAVACAFYRHGASDRISDEDILKKWRKIHAKRI